MPRSTLTNRHRPSACAAVAVSSASYNAERGPLTCPSSSWITTAGDGLRRAPAPELVRGQIKEFSTAVESFTARDGLSDDVVRTILQDREGNIWIGTSNGLDRFRKTNLVHNQRDTTCYVERSGSAEEIPLHELKIRTLVLVP